MKKIMAFAFAVALSVIFSPPFLANATLWDRGGGLIYDDVLDITWLQDANYPATELSDARINAIIQEVGSIESHSLVPEDFNATNGEMTWWGAMAWTNQLEYNDPIRNVIWNDWRLPDAYNQDGSGPGMGYDVTDSEMGYMHYNNLGGWGGGGPPQPNPTFIDGNGNTVTFLNLPPNESAEFWYATKYNLDMAYDFFFTLGRQNASNVSTNRLYSWAVMDGDVAPIPEPATVLLLGTGLIGLAGIRRKLKKIPTR